MHYLLSDEYDTTQIKNPSIYGQLGDSVDWYGGLGIGMPALLVQPFMSSHYQHYMSGAAMNNVLSNGNHTNDNNTTAPSFSLSVDAAAVAVTLP